MNEVNKVKCGKCGFENMLGTKKCVKCHEILKHTRKGCPKCAKVNSIDAKKCVKCGYSFENKGNLLRNLFFSLGIMAILFIFLVIDKSLIKDIKIGFRIAAAFVIVGIVAMTLTYGSKDVIKYNAEEEIVDNSHFKKKKMFGALMIIIGIALAAGFIIYYYFIK